MRHDRPNAVSSAGSSPGTDEAYALAVHANETDVVAVRGGRAIRRTEFIGDVMALAARLPDHKYVINLCVDRYRFTVAFCAALCRRQLTLLPPGTAQGVLEAVAADYPDVYALTETEFPTERSMVYPDQLHDGGRSPAVPSVAAEQPAVVLFTSGSTGRPQPVPKSWGTLVRSAKSAGNRLGVARLAEAILIGTVPHQHSYGLESTILLALQHGLVIEADRLFFPADIRAAIEAASGPRILVTTPIHIRAMVAERDGMPSVDLILSATAPLSIALAGQAEACFDAPLIEIYGCTEAGQVATRRTVRERDWRCLDGVALRGEQGGTWASGAAVEGDALLHDVITPTGIETFLLGGRSADVVDVAGKRTSLAHLNHQLMGIDGVKDGVFFVPNLDGHPITRLAALAVAPGLKSETILRALRERVDAAFLPRPLILVETLPRTALGKLPRAALLEFISSRQDD
jgi:acyl-coenzyme A synthetase/AMP-(fatty) acid ligase